MNFDDLQALLSLARTGSLKAAAEASGVPRTTLRRRLDRLREDVGEPLLELQGQGAKLTPSGELLVEKAPRLLAQRESLLEEARRVARHPVGLLRVLVQGGFPAMLTAGVVSRAASAAPELRLELHHDPRPLDRLDEGFDLVVHTGDPPPLRDGYSRVLFRRPLRLMASPAYLGRQGTPRSAEELSEHTLLGLSSEPRAWPLLAGGHLPIQPAHLVDELYLLGCLAAADLGIALIPREGLGVHPAVEALVPILDEVVGEDIVVRAFLPTRESAHGASSAVLDKIRDLWERG